MRPAIAYVATLITFGAVDFVWLSVMAKRLYLPTLGDMLLDDVRIPPAVVFYLLYPVGVVVFAVLPALKSANIGAAIGLGALFGLIAYATYDLTNFATLKNWNLTITVADMAYGAVATAIAASAAFMAVKSISPD